MDKRLEASAGPADSVAVGTEGLTRRAFLGLPARRMVETEELPYLPAKRHWRKAAVGLAMAASVLPQDLAEPGVITIDSELAFADTEQLPADESIVITSLEEIDPPSITETPPSPQATIRPETTTTTTIQAAEVAPIEITPGVDPRVELAMRSMELSLEGYQQFMASIDTSRFEFAQQFPDFNPGLVAIEQGPTEFVVWHFTTFYRNASGISNIPEGDIMLEPLIESLANRPGVCCGINLVNDRHGIIHQTAPLQAKLRHNPPYDSVNVGMEFEADTITSITSAQFESGAYATLMTLVHAGLLRTPDQSLDRLAMGHGELRQEWNHNNPDNRYDVRTDFNGPEAWLYRQLIMDFYRANPEVLNLPVNLA